MPSDARERDDSSSPEITPPPDRAEHGRPANRGGFAGRVAGALSRIFTGSARSIRTRRERSNRSANPPYPEFSAKPRLLWISFLAVIIGTLWALGALGLEALIGLLTNAIFYHRFSTTLTSPSTSQLGLWILAPPIGGALAVGLLARLGSPDLRRGGTSVTVERVTIKGSRVSLRLGLLEPLLAVIAIGTGQPVGAEGPLILTGGAFGSLVSQSFKLSPLERRTLLAAGATAGMAATFGAPLAATLFGVELLLYEFKLRSLVPVALASGMAALVRRRQMGVQPLFPLPAPHPISSSGLLGAFVVGLLAGLLGWLLTSGTRAVEQAFQKLPLPRYLWPAVASVVVGVGGFFVPRTLGVGYDTIHGMLLGQFTMAALVALLSVKAISWCATMGGGTVGGIIAPLLFMGGALGGIESIFLPGSSSTTWVLAGAAATLAAGINVPLTAIALAIELTHAAYAAVPLVIACMVADTVGLLLQRHSLVTEKVVRSGYHLVREYGVDPLQVLAVREVMETSFLSVTPDVSQGALRERLAGNPELRRQRLYPVVNPEGSLVGLVTHTDLADLSPDAPARQPARCHPNGSQREASVGDIMRTRVVSAYPDEALQVVVSRMLEADVSRLPVIAREHPHQVIGLVSEHNVLSTRERQLAQERHRERVFHLTILLPGARHRNGNATSDAAAREVTATGDTESGTIEEVHPGPAPSQAQHGEDPNSSSETGRAARGMPDHRRS